MTLAIDPQTGSAPALRPPETVMRLERMGSFHQTRLSFMRSLLRRIAREGWRLTRERFDLDDTGVGTAVYAVRLPRGTVRLVAFGHELAPEDRTDRVIAERWDATFALTTGPADEAALARLRANVPLQEAGRCSPKEFVLSRANKSMRLFEGVIAALAAGRQPRAEDISGIGYLMRTTAVYGNGKFGLSDLANTFGSGLFSRPFEAELFTVYLIREFTFDLVAHLARVRAPETAVALAPETKRMLGIGNATGLGMAPFLLGHPKLIDAWMAARETAIARVRALSEADTACVARFFEAFGRAIAHIKEWRTDDARFMARIETLRTELPAFRESLEASDPFQGSRPWDAVCRSAEARLSLEGQELVNSLILEPHGDLVDDLEDRMVAEEALALKPGATLGALADTLRRDYAWALEPDYDDPAARHFFWYVSEEKLEPRLGERFSEPGAEKEMPIGVGRAVKRLYEAIRDRDPAMTTAAFLMQAPEHRRTLRRVQGLANHPYAEIRDNLLARDMVAVDILRCKLAMFGAIKFDPKSDRWTRITMYQGAPAFAELDTRTADDWAFPAFLG